MFDYPVAYVDIETTGGSYRNSRVLEIAIVRVEKGRSERVFISLLDPEAYIPAGITQLTGITSSDVQGMPIFADVAQQISEILDGAVFIAHNVRFDYSFIKHEFERIGMTFSPKLLCTVRLSRSLYSHEKGHSLAKLIERHAIPVADRHRALEDARAMQYFTELAFKEHGLELFNQAVGRQLKSQSLPPHLDVAVIDAIKDVPGVYIFKDQAGLPLYIGKSVTLRKRVMSHFQSTASKELKISQQVHQVETIATSSELGALILESRMIKELQPLYNRLLRRTSLYAMLVKSDVEGYATLAVRMGNVEPGSDMDSLYGIYRNRTQAKKKILDVTRVFGLCPKLMSIEKATGACFSYELGKCKGACIGKESPELYNRRFEIALGSVKIPLWEYQSAVSVPINESGESVIIDRWIIQGFMSPEGERIITDYEPTFDVDEFKIIYRFLKQNRDFVRMIDQG